MDLSAVTDKVKSVPPIAWIVAAGVVILVVVVKGGSGAASGSSGGVVSGGGGGGSGGGDTPPDIGQQIVDLSEQVRLNSDADAAFRDTINDYINTAGAIPTPATPGTPATPATPAVARNSLWGGNISASIAKAYDPKKLGLALRRAGPGTQTAKTAYGTKIDTEDLVRAFRRAHISYGRVITSSDIDKLLKAEGINPTTAKVATK